MVTGDGAIGCMQERLTPDAVGRIPEGSMLSFTALLAPRGATN
jgi:hypothetical protein